MQNTIKKLNRKSLILPIAILATAGAITLGTVSANAYFGKGEHHDEMVKELAEKLGVDESKVQTAFETIHQEHEKEMQQMFEDRLTQAVTDGKISENQKQAITAKHDELEKKHEASRETFHTMTPQERRETHQTDRTELENWANSQGIDLDYFFGPKGGHMGRGMEMIRDWDSK